MEKGTGIADSDFMKRSGLDGLSGLLSALLLYLSMVVMQWQIKT